MNDSSNNNTAVGNDPVSDEARVYETLMALTPNPPMEPESNPVDAWSSTIGSIILLGANVYLLFLYNSLFGFHLIAQDSPVHWEWMGGLVGLFAVLIRMAVIGVFACPYTICAMFGIKMSRRVAKQSPDMMGIFNWCLLACHTVMLSLLIFPLFLLMTGLWS